MVLNTYSFSCTKPKLVRSTILLSSPMLLIYNLITGSIGGMINEILVEIFSVIGLFRYDLKKQVDAKAGGNEKA
ncbi:MAG: YgjV family protein [Lachnospiraceae bacterium]|nr:YgjV family protein [Lachnospiraceae bacterium]